MSVIPLVLACAKAAAEAARADTAVVAPRAPNVQQGSEGALTVSELPAFEPPALDRTLATGDLLLVASTLAAGVVVESLLDRAPDRSRSGATLLATAAKAGLFLIVLGGMASKAFLQAGATGTPDVWLHQITLASISTFVATVALGCIALVAESDR